MKRNITINATGCCLVDRIVDGVDFLSSAMMSYLSKEPGDGGLSPGQLVFRENLEAFTGKALEQILEDLNSSSLPIEKNIGGPSIIAMICAAQMLPEQNISLNFFQNHGQDENGKYIIDQLKQYAPSIGTTYYSAVEGQTAETTVLSDPSFNKGTGERTFINTIGTAGLYGQDSLPAAFFEGDILLFGATALTPAMHESLGELLKEGKERNRINIVTTVFDFLNESRSSIVRWPLGHSTESYSLIDLLITDHVEALRLSGTDNLNDAITRFHSWKLAALIVTNGAEDVTFYASENSPVFSTCPQSHLPVVDYVTEQIQSKKIESGDTTGCGDNFAGGVLVSLVEQILRGQDPVDLKEAVILGNCTGASACYHLGGMFREKQKEEKRKKVDFILRKYRNEI